MMRLLVRASVLAALSVFAAGASAEPQEWTVLVFLNGFNDLDHDGYVNLNQMEKVGSTDQVNIVVEWGSRAQPHSTKRLLVKRDNDEKHVTSPVLEELGKVDMGDPEELKKFLLWGIAKFPARHYVAVVWDHGGGWHLVSPASASRIHPQDISWDDISGNFISTEQLGRVIREVSRALGRKLDIYASDACSMAMGEVAAEMRDAVEYFAGSQELEPESGWPYDEILAALVAHPEMTSADLADLIAKSYVHVNAGVEDATFSVYDMNYFSGLEQSVAELSKTIAVLPRSERSATLKLVKQSQKFYGDYGDLGDFVRRLERRGRVQASVLRNVQQALQDLVISNYMTNKYPNTRGLSLWLPSDARTYGKYSHRYQDLGFEQRTHWSGALSAYLH